MKLLVPPWLAELAKQVGEPLPSNCEVWAGPSPEQPKPPRSLVMQRTPMKRGNGFKRPTLERTRTIHKPIPANLRRGVVARVDQVVRKVEKEQPLQHTGYMDAVRGLPCAHCGKPPRSEFCHSDEGKGQGIKSDCRLGWPGCHDCHYAIGTKRIYDRETRRSLEADMARQTRQKITDMGLWPATLPGWTET